MDKNIPIRVHPGSDSRSPFTTHNAAAQPVPETEPQTLAYSHERVVTTAFDSPPPAPRIAPPSASESVAPMSAPTFGTLPSRLLLFVSNLRNLSLADAIAYLKQTGRIWLTTAGVILALVILSNLTQRAISWAREVRERRHEAAVATVTPDRLVARCGEAAHDVTKEVFPILMRTMSYTAAGDRTIVLSFSRTAEDKSDWVFLSMIDQNGSDNYDTADAKIAALPCLDSTK